MSSDQGKSGDAPEHPDDFNVRIQQYVKDAEAHMDLPPGTIGNTWNDSDFLFVVKMCAVIEPLLREAVREHVRRVLEFARLMTRGSNTLLESIGDLRADRLRKILVEFGAIDDRISNFVYALFEVRHRYAHHIANAHLKVPDICAKIADEGGDGSLLKKLAGSNQPILPGSVAILFLRSLMFFNVAWFLRGAVNMAKPPPTPSGGILGPYFDEIAKATAEGAPPGSST